MSLPAPESRPPVPPFSRETAIQKVRAAEDAWNTRDPERVALAYTPDSRKQLRSHRVPRVSAVYRGASAASRYDPSGLLDANGRAQTANFTDSSD